MKHMFAYAKMITDEICAGIRVRNEKDKHMQKIKADLIVIGVIIGIAFLVYIFSYLVGERNPGKVEIRQDGKLLSTYSLTENQTIIVPYDDGGYNLVLMNEGEVKVTDADCPDKLCVRQRGISRNGESIICLPHKMVIQISAEEESDLDAVTY